MKYTLTINNKNTFELIEMKQVNSIKAAKRYLKYCKNCFYSVRLSDPYASKREVQQGIRN